MLKNSIKCFHNDKARLAVKVRAQYIILIISLKTFAGSIPGDLIWKKVESAFLAIQQLINIVLDIQLKFG